MCTYLTEKVQISGSGKGPAGWFKLTDASVYFDHPVHAQAEHTLNIDFLDPAAGPSARVAVELTAESARALAQAIQATLDSAPPGLVLAGPARLDQVHAGSARAATLYRARCRATRGSPPR
jgi:hypothetical protein